MYFIIATGYALMGNILFGIANVEFYTVYESFYTMFKMTIGIYNSYEIEYYYTTVKHLFGFSYMVINIILLNIFVAMMISPYFEHYLEMGDIQDNIVKVVLKTLMGEKKPTLKDKFSDKWIDRWKYNLVSSLYRWSNNIYKPEEVYIEQTRFKALPLEMLQKVTQDRYSEYIMNIGLGSSLYDPYYLINNPQEHMRKMTFWVSLVEKYVKRLMDKKSYNNFTQNQEDFFGPEIHKKCRCRGEHNPQCENAEIENDQVEFVISPIEVKKRLWEKASIIDKYRYTRVLQNNYDVLEEDEGKMSYYSSSALSEEVKEPLVDGSVSPRVTFYQPQGSN